MRTYSIFCIILLFLACGAYLFFRNVFNTPIAMESTEEIEIKKQSNIIIGPGNEDSNDSILPQSIRTTPKTIPENILIPEPLVLTSSGEKSDKTNDFPRIITKPGNTGTSLMPISKLACENECEQFSKSDEKEYCRHYCGLNESKRFPDNCANLNGLSKDYCLKMKALETKNPTLCDGISDSNIRSACHDRMIEDFMDKHTNLED